MILFVRRMIGPLELMNLPMVQWDWIHYVALVAYSILGLVGIVTALWIIVLPFRSFWKIGQGIRKRVVEEKEDSL